MKKLILALFTLSAFVVFAQEAKTAKPTTQSAYSKGLHYTELDPAYDTDNTEQVIVYEFFGYKCPHCSSFQTYVKPWHEKLPKHVKLVRVPVVFQPGWDILAKAYYTAETMGIIDKTHQPLFDAIHKQRKQFRSIENIADWFADNFSVDRDAFLATANSFMIDSKIRQSNNMMRKMNVTSTPQLVINGKYKPNVKTLGSIPATLDLATYLSNQEAVSLGLVK